MGELAGGALGDTIVDPIASMSAGKTAEDIVEGVQPMVTNGLVRVSRLEAIDLM